MKVLRRSKVKAVHQVEVRNKKGVKSKATLEIKYERILLHPPLYKQKEFADMEVTVISAKERGKVIGRDRINWRLLSDLPVGSKAEAIEMLERYAMRWNIETFHKILKSGFGAEKSKLRSVKRITRLIATFCLLGWRVFWMTKVQRSTKKQKPSIAFTDVEQKLLDRVVPTQKQRGKKHLSDYLLKVARLGGYLARANDSPPGNLVMWRGINRLTDIHLGFLIHQEFVGN